MRLHCERRDDIIEQKMVRSMPVLVAVIAASEFHGLFCISSYHPIRLWMHDCFIKRKERCVERAVLLI